MKFLPTYLYIKQHTITGKLYFGKTYRKNPDTYLGSGTYWRNHIKKHGEEHVVTLWFELFDDIFELVAFALSFSKKLDIVKSASWLNQIDENGLGGSTKGCNKNKAPWNKGIKGLVYSKHKQKRTEEHKRKISSSVIKHRTEYPKLSNKTIKYPNRKKRAKISHERIACPHCGQLGGSNIIKRWHFANCRSQVLSYTASEKQ